ncbi:MAG: DNA repair protein RecN [Acidimicrobiales bacterium]
MLSELRVSQLGVIVDLRLVFGPGMTALTGETGAGKTLVVEAVELLTGGRADATLVRPGAAEAVVDARFVGLAPAGETFSDGDGQDQAGGGREVVMARVVPVDGRSRAYVDGRMATVAALAAQGEALVDLHGQHAHQSLFSSAAQRGALDAYAGVDRGPRDGARARARQQGEAMARAGGDAAVRGRERELLGYQIAELDAAALLGADEDMQLGQEEDRLGQAAAHRAAAQAAHEGLAGDEQVIDRFGQVVSATAGHPPLAPLHERLRGLAAELADAAAEAREAADSLQEDPERLEEVVARRALLKELRRKYAGPAAGLADVIAFHLQARERLQELEDLEGLAQRLAEEHAAARADLRRESAQLGAARRKAAVSFGAAVETELHRLAMPRARFQVKVGGGDGPDGPKGLPGLGGADGPDVTGQAVDVTGQAVDVTGEAVDVTGEAGETGGGNGRGESDLRRLAGEDVMFLLAANPGEPLLPLAKVASGGELARAMLAVRLVLLAGGEQAGRAAGPATLVFDEVDAGVGGEAALAVGRALAELGRQYQVIVVTHLAQVAAFADAQVAVSKVERDGRAVARAEAVTGRERVVELSRMLSGQPDSATARRHAEELLHMAASVAAGGRSAKLSPS